MDTATVKVWDPLVRISHWMLAAAFFFNYLTEGEVMPAHAFVGYGIGAIILIRVTWGFLGPTHARFRDFVRGPKPVAAYVRGLATGRARRYLGHNPAGGAMVVIMLAMLAGTVTTGIVLYGIEEGAGPLAGFVSEAIHDEDTWEEAHEFFANASLFLVGLHIAGVVASSFVHRENLVKAMFTGRKRAAGTGNSV
ncbi:MAG: cytochrome b/b6 domain-containing protein [Gammaproteobacteria bacterium]|nr:cytochrome b/b6 domain-containing protein [Gammaproteobacteria bacterium]